MSHAFATALELAPQVHVACALCQSRRRVVVASAREIAAQRRYLELFHRRRVRDAGDDQALEERAEFTHDYATRVVECVGCGLLYRDPHPPAAAIREAYADDEYGAERLEALFDSQLELFRPKARALRQRLANCERPTVIEVGSFVGGFLAAMREQGAGVLGLDPGAEVSAFCAAKGLEVVRATPEDYGAVAAADCVAVWNTFDQIPRPQATLTAIRRLLRPGGLLVIRVPNGACFRGAMDWLRRGPRSVQPWLTAAMAWNNLLTFPYLHGYSAATLDRLLRRQGFVRVDFRPDVLTRLADAQTKWWAAQEEKLLKALWLAAARLDVMHAPHGAALTPWFDAYYRLSPWPSVAQGMVEDDEIRLPGTAQEPRYAAAT